MRKRSKKGRTLPERSGWKGWGATKPSEKETGVGKKSSRFVRPLHVESPQLRLSRGS